MGLLDVDPRRVNQLGQSSIPQAQVGQPAGTIDPNLTIFASPYTGTPIPATAVQTIPILDCPGDGDVGGRQSLCQLQAEILVPGVQSFDLKARLDWGVAGAQYTALVDFVKGQSIALAATALQVTGVYVRTSAGSSHAIKLGAALVYGTRPNTQFGPTFTTGLVLLAGGGAANQSFPIPLFANWFRVLRSDPTQIAQVSVQTDGSGAIYNENLAANEKPPVFPIPNGAAKVNVLNQGAGADSIAIIYGLCL